MSVILSSVKRAWASAGGKRKAKQGNIALISSRKMPLNNSLPAKNPMPELRIKSRNIYQKVMLLPLNQEAGFCNNYFTIYLYIVHFMGYFCSNFKTIFYYNKMLAFVLFYNSSLYWTFLLICLLTNSMDFEYQKFDVSFKGTFQ